MFERIGRNNTLQNKVAEYISKLIEQGKIKSGDRLPTERDMAEKFGVSRTVVRDAVKTLAGIGVLEVRHGVGIFVATPDSQHIAKQLSGLLYNNQDTINNLIEVRMVLETAVAGWAAKRHSKEDLKNMAENLKSHEEIIKTGDLIAIGEIDRGFHLLLANSSKNPVAIRLMQNLLDLLQVSSRQTLTIEGRIKQSIEEHYDIYEAINEKDKQKAQEKMKVHLLSIANSFSIK
ncbi:FadR/GntR family transcriptional regulator [Desulfoscipio sp. XC116]|uniref:FadR/GntR family transcriptional regulator n=1 Tax=Desulfoscipio sp. XC116 TaxID=3144975 RepID=UPI00325AFC9E